MGGTHGAGGGTGKAEDAKLPDAGISPSSAQENEWQKKVGVLDSVRIIRGPGAWKPSQGGEGSEVASAFKAPFGAR